MRIGKPKPKGVAGVPPVRKAGDPLPDDYKGRGCPTKYRPEYCESLVRYFDRKSWCVVTDAKGTQKVMPKDDIPILDRWCLAIGVPRRTIYDWIKTHPEFADAHDTAMGLQKAFLIESGLVHGSGGFASFMLKCVHGMQEPKADSDEKEGKAQNITVVIQKDVESPHE